MQYFSLRFDSFIIKLRHAMEDRISAFEKYMCDEFRNHPDKSAIKSKRQWMHEYQKWITKNNAIEKEILKYLKESEQHEE